MRSFNINYNKELGELSYSNKSVSPIGGDPSKYRRRDLNVINIISQNDENEYISKDVLALAGVFYNGKGVWTVPVIIDSAGIPTTYDPNLSLTFKQPLQQYSCANIGLYSKKSKITTQVLFGGISANIYDQNRDELIYDKNYGFTNQISALTILPDNKCKYSFRQSYLGNFPHVPNGDSDKGILFGTNAHFFIAPNIPLLSYGVIDEDALVKCDVVIGHIYGGIGAEKPNYGKTVASPVIFEVVINCK